MLSSPGFLTSACSICFTTTCRSVTHTTSLAHAKLYADALEENICCWFQELVQLVQKTEINEHYSICINMMQLAAFDIGLAETLIENPRETLLVLDKAAVSAQYKVVQEHQTQNALSVKGLVHARVWGMPFHLDHMAASVFPGIGSIRSCHVDRLLTVSGTVVRTGSVTMIESHKLYECTRCHDR